jgi:hypothetical protein
VPGPDLTIIVRVTGRVAIATMQYRDTVFVNHSRMKVGVLKRRAATRTVSAMVSSYFSAALASLAGLRLRGGSTVTLHVQSGEYLLRHHL